MVPAFRLQYISGLFAPGWRSVAAAVRPLPGVNAIALLGNCGSAKNSVASAATEELLRYCSDSWPRVFWIPGPSEHAGPGTFYDSLERCRDIAAVASKPGGQIQVLNQTEIYDCDRDIVFLGTTGWTPMADVSEKGGIDSCSDVNTWCTEKNALRPVRAGDIRNWHRDDMLWLQGKTNWWSMHKPAVRIVVLTHHLCSPLLLGSGKNEELMRRFPSECIPMESSHPVLSSGGLTAWLCGAGNRCVSGNVSSLRDSFVYGAVNPLSSPAAQEALTPAFDIPMHKYG